VAAILLAATVEHNSCL